MKRTVLVLLIAMFGFSSSLFAKELKIGYADALSMFNDYKKTKEYEKALDEKKQKQEKENKLVEKKEAIIKMQDKLALLSEKEQAKERDSIREAITKYRELENKIFTELKAESDEKMKEVLEDINKAIEKYAKAKKFDLILNRGAVIYGNDKIDVTADVSKILNK